MDFLERFTDKVNSIPDLPIQIQKGYLTTDESLVVYPLPAGRVTSEYFDGTKDVDLNFEIAMKSKSQEKIHSVLWIIQNEIDRFTDIQSSDNSFDFNEIIVGNKPYINETDDQGWFIFLLDFTAKITIHKTEGVEN